MVEFSSGAKVYLVGGAVRDMVMKEKVKDRDFVVVGATEQEMLDHGFKKIVATSFPVFHHPVTKDEYALARKERKTGKGYHGFTCDFDPSVTIEEDLYRRDLTINAMAIKVKKIYDDGEVELDEHIIDPYGGQKDIDAGTMRHVSEHFAEDPVRALRVARLAARYMLDIHQDTIALVKNMVRNGELLALTKERVWGEVEKAMNENHSGWFFKNLQTLNVINVVFPGMEECFDEQVPRYVSCGKDINEKLMVLCSRVPPEILATRMTIPNNILKDIRKFHSLVFKLRMMAPIGFTENQVMPIFKEMDVFRDKTFLHKALHASCNFEDEYLHEQLFKLVGIFYEVSQVGYDRLNDIQREMSGYDIGKAIDELREREVQEYFSRSHRFIHIKIRSRESN